MRAGRLMLAGGVILTALLFALWALVTQPLLPVASEGDQLSVDPHRLESHVRRLAENFGPHDETHPLNLDRAAAYIRGELERAGGPQNSRTTWTAKHILT